MDFFKWRRKEHSILLKKITEAKISLVKANIVKVEKQPLIKLVGQLKDKSNKISYIQITLVKLYTGKKMWNIISKIINIRGVVNMQSC